MPSSAGRLVLSAAGGVGRLTFSNPAKYNALSYSMWSAIPAALADLDADPEVRVVVVAGAGDKAFISGADISEFGDRRTSVAARVDYDAAAELAEHAWESFSKPLIASIGGYCIGGGLATAMQADIRIASSDSQFAIPAARLGLGYKRRSIEYLLRFLPPASLAELFFTAGRFGAADALRMGLLNQVVDRTELASTVDTLAATIAANAPMTLKAAKAAIRNGGLPLAHRDPHTVDALIDACFDSSDYLEGQAAFAAKRPPQFTGS